MKAIERLKREKIRVNKDLKEVAGTDKMKVIQKQKELTEKIIYDILYVKYTGEAGDAELVRNIYFNAKLYDHDEKFWYSYQNGVWKRDDKKNIVQEIQNKLIEIHKDILNNRLDEFKEEVKNCTDADTGEVKENAKMKKLKKLLGEINARIKSINTKNHILHVLELASSGDTLGATAEEFDADPYLFNLKNCTYDFRNFVAIPHNPANKFKICSGASFDEDAVCDKWHSFLNKVFDNNQELIKFVQKLCGIWLTGTYDFQYIMFAYGSGANGKSTLFNTMQMLLNGVNDLGEKNSKGYYLKIPIDTLLFHKTKQSSEDYSKAQLKGMRLAVASEIPKGAKLNSALLKDLSGGDAVDARQIYGRPFMFEPTHKIVMFGNTKPSPNDFTGGFERRMKLIPFNITIPPEERREQSDIEAEFRAELAGILNWCIQGYKDYKIEKKNKTFKIPDIVEIASKEYMKEFNILSEFLDAIKEDFAINQYDKSLKIESKLFLDAFKKWCEEEPTERENIFKSTKSFNTNIRERGFTVEKGTDNKTFIFGIEAIDKSLRLI